MVSAAFTLLSLYLTLFPSLSLAPSLFLSLFNRSSISNSHTTIITNVCPCCLSVFSLCRLALSPISLSLPLPLSLSPFLFISPFSHTLMPRTLLVEPFKFKSIWFWLATHAVFLKLFVAHACLLSPSPSLCLSLSFLHLHMCVLYLLHLVNKLVFIIENWFPLYSTQPSQLFGPRFDALRAQAWSGLRAAEAEAETEARSSTPESG